MELLFRGTTVPSAYFTCSMLPGPARPPPSHLAPSDTPPIRRPPGSPRPLLLLQRPTKINSIFLYAKTSVACLIYTYPFSADGGGRRRGPHPTHLALSLPRTRDGQERLKREKGRTLLLLLAQKVSFLFLLFPLVNLQVSASCTRPNRF